MEFEKFKYLENKYWKGETTIDEEAMLQEAVTMNPEYASPSLKAVFGYSSNLKEVKLPEQFEADFWNRVDEESGTAKVIPFRVDAFIRYAAVGIILLALSFSIGHFLMNNDDHTHTMSSSLATTEDTYQNPKEAFEEAKKALLYASVQMKKGTSKVNELKRLDQTMSAIESRH